MAAEAENNQEQETIIPGSMADLLGGLIEEKTVVDLHNIDKSKIVAAKEEKKPGSKKPAGEEKPVEEDPEQEEEEEEDPADEQEEEEEESEEEDAPEDKKTKKSKKEEPELKNKFGIKLNKKEEKKGPKIDIKDFSELPSVLKSKYGQEIKDVKDLPKFFEAADKWRADSQQLEKVKSEKDNAVAIFEGLPDEMLEAIKLHYAGEDYKKVFESGPKLDFSKDVEKQDIKKLVNAFYPGEFKDEDFEADEQPKELKIAITASKKEFNSQKTAREQRAKDQVEKAQRQSEAYKNSVSGSVKFLKTAFPDMAQDDLAEVEQTLSSGQLMSKFLNPDGTYKPEAAKKLMLAEYGEELIEQLMKIAAKRGESEANEEIVERASGKPKGKNGAKPEKIRKEVTEKVEKLLPQGLYNKRTF